MEETAKQRLLLFIKELGYGQTKFESLAGLSNGYISKLKSSPSTEIVRRIVGNFPQLNAEWLLTGEGPMLVEQEVSKPESDATMNLKERIAELLRHSHLNCVAFAKEIGAKTPQTIYEILKGRTKNLSPTLQTSILMNYPEINPTWLLTGEGPMLVEQEVSKPEPEAAAGYRMVPIVHIDSVGGLHSPNDILAPEFIEGHIPLAGAREGDLAIYQSGSSMAPAIPPGAILQIREVPDWLDYIGYGDVFVLLLNDYRRITKEIQRYPDDPQNYFWAVSYNPSVADEELPKRMVRRVWKVIKVLIDKGW